MRPFPTIVQSLLCLIAFLPGESAIKLLISSSNPETILLVEGSPPVMMASANPNKTPPEVISPEMCFFCFSFNDCQFGHDWFWGPR